MASIACIGYSGLDSEMLAGHEPAAEESRIDG